VRDCRAPAWLCGPQLLLPGSWGRDQPPTTAARAPAVPAHSSTSGSGGQRRAVSSSAGRLRGPRDGRRVLVSPSRRQPHHVCTKQRQRPLSGTVRALPQRRLRSADLTLCRRADVWCVQATRGAEQQQQPAQHRSSSARRAPPLFASVAHHQQLQQCSSSRSSAVRRVVAAPPPAAGGRTSPRATPPQQQQQQQQFTQQPHDGRLLLVALGR
jgi:hypothetical protein